mmetsp:Transcript_121357/g.343405  ORF Transcript_121357/g.343405 Transcript_121357/m.343405 type:complete len:231 (+) Transcript_121357:580-1272(+)
MANFRRGLGGVSAMRTLYQQGMTRRQYATCKPTAATPKCCTKTPRKVAGSSTVGIGQMLASPASPISSRTHGTPPTGASSCFETASYGIRTLSTSLAVWWSTSASSVTCRFTPATATSSSKTGGTRGRRCWRTVGSPRTGCLSSRLRAEVHVGSRSHLRCRWRVASLRSRGRSFRCCPIPRREATLWRVSAGATPLVSCDVGWRAIRSGACMSPQTSGPPSISSRSVRPG